MSQVLCLLVCMACILQTCWAPPVSQNQNKQESDSAETAVNGLDDYMEYHRYLKEVVSALESDPDFRQKLEKAESDDIKSGKIAEELEFVSHHVRSRLDEIKRVELERLKELIEKKRRLEDPSNSIDEDPLHHHVDHSNPHTFEIEDLKKLIKKTTDDLAEVDKKRKDQFKQYEMEKEYKKQEKLNHTTGEEHENLEKQYKEMEEKHKKHEKLHEPGHKAQLEEVWEEQDQMQQEFDPKAFFMLHDIDGNGLWDQNEVKALFLKELDKMYQQGAPEDDLRERYEEMERMRESVFTEMDKNRDGFIDYNEFIHQTNTAEFKEDHGWKGLDEQHPFTDEELAEYIRQNHPEIAPGLYEQVPPNAYQPSGGYQGPVPPSGYQQVPPGAYQQVPPGGYQQVPPGSYQQHPQGANVPPAAYQELHQGPHGAYQANSVQQHQVPQMQLNTNEIHPQQHGIPAAQPNVYHQQVQPQQHQAYQQPPMIQQENLQANQQQQNIQANQQQQIPQVNQQQQIPQVSQQQQIPQVNQQQQIPQVNQQQQIPQTNQQQQSLQVNQQQQLPQVNQQQIPQVNQQK